MALPGAGKRLKPPKGKGVKFRDMAGDIASMPIFESNPNDPALLSIGKTTGTYALSGFAFGGPIGGVIGGAVGFISSIFNLNAREEAELARMRAYVEKYARAKQQQDTRLVEARISQLGQTGRAVRSDVNRISTYLHQSLGAELNAIKRPTRVTSFSQTGRLGAIQSSQFDKVLLAQSRVISDKTTATLAGRRRALEDIEEWKEDIEGADRDVVRQYGHERWAYKNLDKEVKHSKAYEIAKDEDRTTRLRRQLENTQL